MTGTARVRLLCGVLLLILPTAALAAGESPDPFPRYDALEGNVAFWTRVFAEWRLDQIVVHDLDHPSVVYEITDLPGPTEFPYTDEQRERVDGLRERWEDRLREIERRVAEGEPLSDADKAVVLTLTTTAGTDAVRGAHERVRTQRGLRERFRRGLEISNRYMERFREIFRAEGLPEDLAYLPHVESSFQYEARSTAGAVGVWQFTRGTGRHFLKIDSAVDERLDPVAATLGAARYLREAYETLGHWPLAVTSYNHGLQGMIRAQSELGTDFERIVREYRGRTFGFASRNFYAEFLAARDIARAPERFFPEGLAPEPPHQRDEVVLTHRASPDSLAREYGVPVDELAGLNPAWSSRAVTRGYALPEGTRVWLPLGAAAQAATARVQGVEHVVRPGDSLSVLAKTYDTTVDDLRRLNGMSDGQSVIRVGQTLVVRPGNLGEQPPLATHRVRSGENLSTIAKRYGMSVDDLRGMNGLSSRQSLIHPGQRLVVAGGRAAPSWATHTVRPGENLSRIASRYGMTVDELRRVNGMSSGDSLIRPGQALRVPGDSPASVVHVVRRGDTLTEIAAAYGIRLGRLLSANRLRRNSTIYPGQSIHIPR